MSVDRSAAWRDGAMGMRDAVVLWLLSEAPHLAQHAAAMPLPAAPSDDDAYDAARHADYHAGA